MPLSLTRRAALGAALATLAAGPVLAQEALEDRGYALGDMTLGDPDAPVKIVEYVSLTCGHCADFHTDTWPEVKARYVDTGQVHLTFREVYFDQFGLWAGMVSRCGGEDAYFGLVDAYLERQDEWLGVPAEQRVGEIVRIGRLAGLPADRIRACLSDEEFLESLVGHFQETTTEDGIRSTPSFVINGDLFTGNMPDEEFFALIEDRL
jgi:protein-disulfide isomerase